MNNHIESLAFPMDHDLDALACRGISPGLQHKAYSTQMLQHVMALHLGPSKAACSTQMLQHVMAAHRGPSPRAHSSLSTQPSPVAMAFSPPAPPPRPLPSGTWQQSHPFNSSSTHGHHSFHWGQRPAERDWYFMLSLTPDALAGLPISLTPHPVHQANPTEVTALADPEERFQPLPIPSLQMEVSVDLSSHCQQHSRWAEGLLTQLCNFKETETNILHQSIQTARQLGWGCSFLQKNNGLSPKAMAKHSTPTQQVAVAVLCLGTEKVILDTLIIYSLSMNKLWLGEYQHFGVHAFPCKQTWLLRSGTRYQTPHRIT